MKGGYYAELYDGNRRRSLSLRTSDPEIALQRYGDGMKALADKIRREHQAAKPKTPLTWLPSEPATVWEVPDGMEMTIENLEKHGIERQTTADEVLPDEQLRDLTWDDLVENARTIRRRTHGKDYGKAWLKNTKTVLSTVDFRPAGLTPQRIRRWLDEQEKKGLSAVTMKNRASCLQGLVERAITSGFQPQLAPNVFKQVHFGISREVEKKRHYYCPTPEDYRKLFNEVLPEQPERIRLGIELLAFTGCRISGVPYLSSSTEPGWLDVPEVDGVKGGGRTPVPMDIWIRGRDTKISVHALNKVLRQVDPRLSNHGMRSGVKYLARRAGVMADLSESLLMHSQKKLEAVYGGGFYPDEALKPAAEKIWAMLTSIIE